MLNLISKASPKTARRVVKLAAKTAEKLGATVRQDRDGAARYFIQTEKDHYIISARSKKSVMLRQWTARPIGRIMLAICHSIKN